MAQDSLDEALDLVDDSVRFMLLLILGILLSFAALLIQRQQLRAARAGEDPDSCPDPSPLRLLAGVITLWCAGFFFSLALRGLESVPEGDPGDLRLSRADLWASLLALAASFLRLWVLGNEETIHSPVGAENGALLPQFIENSLPA